MALYVDNQGANNTTSLKHLCRICKKGFGCGRALGGHMRAHGSIGAAADVNDDINDDDEEEEEWDNQHKPDNNPPPPSNKRMYALRANPNNRLRTCRACEHCGREFSSWKSFLEHGKCVSEDADSLVSSSKRKRSSFRAGPSSEEEDLASCLMMLSNAAVEAEESCASASRDDNHKRINAADLNAFRVPEDQTKTKGLFECKACKKVFNSHQALGGHRASHKKVKGCFAARLDQTLTLTLTHDQYVPPSARDEDRLFFPAEPAPRKSKVHECSICHRVFSSGQALGGHKRCHWITSNSGAAASEATAALAKFQESIEQINLAAAAHHRRALDLNLPADDGGVSTEIFLQPWLAGSSAAAKREDIQRDRSGDLDVLRRSDGVDEGERCNKNGDADVSVKNGNVIEDEADSKVKLGQLSELKDMNASEGSSPWLQVGIGSTTDVESTVP